MNTNESSTNLSVSDQAAAAAALSNCTSAKLKCPPTAAASSESKQEEEFGLIKAELDKHLNTCRANALAWQIEAAKHLAQLQEELLAGEWTRLFTDPDHQLPVGNIRTAQLWARVASNAALVAPKNFALLPTALSSLSALAGVKPEVLQPALDSGRITPDSTAREVTAFVREARGLPAVRRMEPPPPKLI